MINIRLLLMKKPLIELKIILDDAKSRLQKI
jgi:hypothetical protein